MSGRGSRMLHETAQRLTDRQTALLRFLHAHRLATTGQLARLYEHEHASAASALRQATRALRRMSELGLVRTLERRVGGARAGSTGHVWGLTEHGARLLYLVYGVGQAKRYRAAEPGPMFTTHTLAVTELVVRLHEAARAGVVLDVTVQPEPDCWRRYLGSHGLSVTLKPDLAATTTTTEYTDEWFFEIDQGTENPARIIDKCRQYTAYHAQGVEQRERGVFPAVVWLAHTAERAATLSRHVAAATAQGLLPTGMFQVTTTEHLTTLLTDGISAITSTSTGGTGKEAP